MCDSRPPSDLPALVGLVCQEKRETHQAHWARLPGGGLVEWCEKGATV